MYSPVGMENASLIHNVITSYSIHYTKLYDNERIFRVYADIYPELFACTSLRQLWRRLHTSFRDKLHIPASALWLNAGQVTVKRSDKRFLLDEQPFVRRNNFV